MKTKKTMLLTQAAMIAALYVALTFLANQLGLASGAIQIRLSELLTVLPFFTAAAVPGLAVGCLLSNLLTGAVIWDVIFGTAATLLGAVGSRLVRKNKWLVPIPPILANAAIVPWVLKFAYGLEEGIPYMMATVGIGELICCGFLGTAFLLVLNRSGAFRLIQQDS